MRFSSMGGLIFYIIISQCFTSSTVECIRIGGGKNQYGNS